MNTKPVVFVSNDLDATILNDNYDNLVDYCFFEGSPSGNVNQYRNKSKGNALAHSCGFILPSNEIIMNAEDIHNINCKYPIVVKANNSIYGGKSVMKKCLNNREAFDFISTIAQKDFPLQIQEFIEKEYEIMLLGCSLYGGRKVICPIANRKIRHYPNPMGLGSYSESLAVYKSDELKKLVSKIEMYLNAIEYTGNFSAEFLYSKGHYYFLEINLRNDGTSYLSTKSGFNLPDLVCRSFINDNISIDIGVFKKMNYMNTMADVNYFINGSIGWKQWRRQFKENTCYSHYNNNDRLPFKYYIKNPILIILKIFSKRILYIIKHKVLAKYAKNTIYSY